VVAAGVGRSQNVDEECELSTLRTHAPIIPALALVAVIFLIPILFGANQTPVVIGFTLVAIFAYGWNILGGILGEMNFGMLVSWGLGSYLIVYLLTNGNALPVALVFALVAGVAFALVLTFVTTLLQLEGLILAVFTLVVVEIFILVVEVVEFTGGPVGIRLQGSQRFSVEAYHIIGILLLAVLVVITHFLLRSRRGLRWLAIREDAVAAQSVGIRVRRERYVAAMLSGAIGAAGGALQALYLGFALPATAVSISFMILAVLAVFAGGPGTLLGPLIGTVIIYGFALIANPFVSGNDSGFAIRLVQYGLAFLIIRWLNAKGQGDDLGTLIVRGITLRTRKAKRAGSRNADASPTESPKTQTAHAPLASTLEHVPEPRPVRHPGAEILVLDNVAKAFGGLKVLRGVSFSVKAGEFVALVGPNGAGKSTVTNLVVGALRPDTGTVSFLGEPSGNSSPDTMFRRGIARTFQIPRLLPKLSLLDNVAVGCNGDREAARSALEKVGVPQVERKAVNATLFEHRMVEVARALASEARLLILDEPLAGLSPTQRSEVLSAVEEHIDAETGVMIIEHLIPAIAPVVDRMLFLVDGTILVQGTPSDVLADQRVIESYLGQAER
jgi:branched-chain amino acid transport system permease protein